VKVALEVLLPASGAAFAVQAVPFATPTTPGDCARRSTPSSVRLALFTRQRRQVIVRSDRRSLRESEAQVLASQVRAECKECSGAYVVRLAPRGVGSRTDSLGRDQRARRSRPWGRGAPRPSPGANSTEIGQYSVCPSVETRSSRGMRQPRWRLMRGIFLICIRKLDSIEQGQALRRRLLRENDSSCPPPPSLLMHSNQRRVGRGGAHGGHHPVFRIARVG